MAEIQGRVYAGTRLVARTRAILGLGLTALALALSACGDDDGDAPTPPTPTTQGGGVGKSDGSPAGVASASESQRTTFLLSVAADGGFPDGPSRNATVSHDQRIARFMAFESDATNIVGGDTNGRTDVFLVPRAQPYGRNGTPWESAGIQLISKGPGGTPANGASYRPQLDGDSRHNPRCVAFVSDASNLVNGDTNGKPDGFVYDIRSRRITRVSVDSRGRQANGSTYEISIDGACERVAFTSDARNLALTKAPKAAWSRARTTAARPGTRQVYVRVLGGSGLDKGFKGLTFLASQNRGRAGNGDSSQPYLSRSGKSVVFTSTASNLGGRGTNVFRRTMFRKFERVGGKGVQTLQGQTNVVSKGGNGPSSHPSITDDGRYVAYETEATNLLPGDSNGVSDIVRADMRNPARPKQEWVTRTRIGGIANGASHNPVISDAGEFILFDSEADNMRPSESVRPDPNGVRDVFLWNAPTRNVSLESRNAENGYVFSPSQHPATSSRGNYVPFESANPLIDLPLAEKVLPQLVEEPDAVDLDAVLPKLTDPNIPAPQLPVLARPSASDPLARAAARAGQQVYMRYLGPK